MKNRKKALIIVGVVLVIGLIGGWLLIKDRERAAQSEQLAGFNTAVVSRMDLSDQIDATGMVVTEKNASLYPPYNATVKQILVNPGDQVQKGDLLLVLQLKDADLINYGAGWKSSLDQAQANLEIAKRTLERETILYKAQGTTIDQVENAQIKVRQYEAQVLEYRLKLDSLIKNGVDNQNNILIRAPFAAEVSWINVKLEEGVNTSTELLTLGGSSAVRVEAAVDQGDIDQVKMGQLATIQANDQNRTIINGVVTSFGSTGTTNSNVVTFPVLIKPTTIQGDTSSKVGPKKVNGNNSNKRNNGLRKNRPGKSRKDLPNDLKNDNKLGNFLKTGMSVDVTIAVSFHPDLLTIPLRAVIEQKGRTFVKVFRKGKIVSKEVRLGYKNGDYAEVLAGLTEGEQVAIAKLKANGNQNNRRREFGGMGPMGHM